MAVRSTKAMTWRRGLAIYPLALVLVVFTLFPIYWVVNSSLKPDSELFHFPPLYWPSQINLRSYVNAIHNGRLASFYLNSIIVAACTCLATLVLVVFAGYSMSRFRFRGKGVIILMFLTAQMLPAVVLIAPLFTIYSVLHLVNTRWVLIISYVVTSLPFCVLMMRGFFDSLPQDMEEAAMVDGCRPHRRALSRSAAGGIARAGSDLHLRLYRCLERADLRRHVHQQYQPADAARWVEPYDPGEANGVRAFARLGRVGANSEPLPVWLHPALPDQRPHGRRGQGLVRIGRRR